MINKFIPLIVLSIISLCLVSVNVFSAVVNSSEPIKSIPFKPEHTAINDATSTMPYLFLVFILFIAVLYLLNRKFGFINTLNPENDKQNSVKILKMKRITTNTVFFQIKINGAEHMFLESKNTLKEIKPD